MKCRNNSYFPYSFIVFVWLIVGSTFLSADSDSSLHHRAQCVFIDRDSSFSGAVASVSSKIGLRFLAYLHRVTV